MKKMILNIGGFLVIAAAGLLFLGYGNTKNHPTINGFMVESFLNKNNKGNFSMTKFKNYQFDFRKPLLKGDYITVSGLFNPSEIDNFAGDQLSNAELVGLNPTYTEESREVSPEEWIKHGGFSADVPEVPASLRHFYDPTRREGERYLTDKVNSKVMSWFQSNFKNPKTDGVDWALGTQGNFGVLEHNYTWDHGKKYMKAALEETNPDKRKNFMAKAWRSLGETLHMIADNGCPVHVRNDGHPSIPIPLLSYFGNPDPYEELMDEWQKKSDNALDAFKSGPAPKEETEIFRKAKTVKDIAHTLALFTNKNFFTNETISGTDWKGNRVKQVTHPEYEYASPKLSGDIYEKNYYRTEVAGTEVLQCTDTWFFSKYPVSKTYAYVDEECVKSQARVLIPSITEAGVNVIKLFIPELEVKITSLDEEGNITGQINHKTDAEYKDPISYSGPVSILTASYTELAKMTATDGKFSGKVDGGEGQTLFAEIECGGIRVKSESRTMGKKAVKQAGPRTDVMELSVVIYVYASYSNGYQDEKQTFNNNTYQSYEARGDWDEFTLPRGNSFKGIRQDGDPLSTIEGQMNDNEIIWLKIKYHKAWGSGANKIREEWWEAELEHIPLSPNDVGRDLTLGKHYELEGWDFDNVRPNLQFEKSIKKLEHKIIFYPSKTEINLVSFDGTRSSVRTVEELTSRNGWMQPRPFIDIGVSYNVY